MRFFSNRSVNASALWPTKTVDKTLQQSHDILRRCQAALLRGAIRRQLIKRSRERSNTGGNCQLFCIIG
jgi:hypothetical protein